MEPEKSIEDDKVFWFDDFSWFTLGFPSRVIPKVILWDLYFLSVFKSINMFNEKGSLKCFWSIKIFKFLSFKINIEICWKLCIRIVIHIVGDGIHPLRSKSFDDFFSEIAFSRAASADEVNEVHKLLGYF